MSLCATLRTSRHFYCYYDQHGRNEQGYLAHKKTPTPPGPPRILEGAYGRVLGGGAFFDERSTPVCTPPEAVLNTEPGTFADTTPCTMRGLADESGRR